MSLDIPKDENLQAIFTIFSVMKFSKHNVTKYVKLVK